MVHASLCVAWRTVFDFSTFLSLRNGIRIVYCGLGCASMVWLTLLTLCCLLRALHVGCWPWHRESVFQRAVFMHVWHLLLSLVSLRGQCVWCGMHFHCPVTCLCCMCRPRIPSALAMCRRRRRRCLFVLRLPPPPPHVPPLLAAVVASTHICNFVCIGWCLAMESCYSTARLMIIRMCVSWLICC